MSYNGIQNRTSWSIDNFKIMRDQKAKIRYFRDSLIIYLAVDPNDYLDAPIEIEDVSEIKRYAKVPLMIKITDAKTRNFALRIIKKMLAPEGLAEYEEQDFRFPVEPIDLLLEKELVRAVKPRQPKGVETPIAQESILAEPVAIEPVATEKQDNTQQEQVNSQEIMPQ